MRLRRSAAALGAVAALVVLALGVASVGAQLLGANAPVDEPVPLVPPGLEDELAQSFGLGEVTRGGQVGSDI